jgi:PAS domain S-box-containing protein
LDSEGAVEIAAQGLPSVAMYPPDDDGREHARLFAAEQEARRVAEAATDRTRRLQELTTALSTSLEKHQVASVFVDAGRAAVGAAAGYAWLLRDEETLELAAAKDGLPSARLGPFQTISTREPMPVCDALRNRQPMMFESLAAMARSYPHAASVQTGPYRAWAVIPLVLGGRSVGAASFSFSDERTFSDADREMLTAMTGQASLALERCLLLESERKARVIAESARVRERRLYMLAARLASALTREQIAAIVCEETHATLGALTVGAAVSDGDALAYLWTTSSDPAMHGHSDRIPLTMNVPGVRAFKAADLVWYSGDAELEQFKEHEHAWKGRVLSWGGVPIVFEGTPVGAIAVGMREARELSSEEREFLFAIGQVTGQALERARLNEAHQRAEEHLRAALLAARAATWSLDVKTMTSTRDPSYRTLVGQKAAVTNADFMSIHPEDRPIAQAIYARTLRDGTPYEPEVRIQRDDGTYMWIRSHGRLTYDADGKPDKLTGVIVDIDEAKRASMRGEEERRLNDVTYRLASSFARVLDHDRLVQMVVDEVAKLIGASSAVFVDGQRLDSDHAHMAVVIDGPVGQPPFGTLLLGHPAGGRFTADHERLATNIAQHAAIAFENARLYKAVSEHREDLEAAVARAQLADRRKDEFLAMLGHELRNPLAPISTALELMELKGAGAAAVDLKRERDVIRRQVAHLSRLIDDLLDVSRITRGKIQLTREVLELGTVIAKAVEMASPLLEKRGQHLQLDVPRAGLRVDGDATRLAQIFQNLITNASKYSDQQSRIVVRARALGGTVVVEVTDHGMGIPSELLPRLFELFVQGERALDRSEGGLGIGLTIAKSLCELHGGTIEATSGGTGQGSTFKVTLPLAQPAVAGADAATSDVGSAGEANGRLRPDKPARVLVVDDNVDAAQMLRDVLLALGHQPAIAYDGAAALELARSFKPDVAVLDIGLPVMNGYELARQLREQLGSEKLRLIAVTGYGQETDRARAHEVGFDHHLIKPIDLDAILPLLIAR